MQELSSDTSIAELFSYFEKVLRDMNSTRRRLQVSVSLQKSEAMRVLNDWSCCGVAYGLDQR